MIFIFSIEMIALCSLIFALSYQNTKNSIYVFNTKFVGVYGILLKTILIIPLFNINAVTLICTDGLFIIFLAYLDYKMFECYSGAH